MFGDPEVLPVKVIWDYTYYWGVLCAVLFQRRLADLTAFAELKAELAHCQALNREVQALLRDGRQHGRSKPCPTPPQCSTRHRCPGSPRSTRACSTHLDDAAFRERIRHSTQLMRILAAEIADRAEASAGVAAPALRQLLEEKVARPVDGALCRREPMLFGTTSAAAAARAAEETAA